MNIYSASPDIFCRVCFASGQCCERETDRYKPIHFYYSMDAWELFDLQNDPNELKNRINDPEYADVLQQMKAELERQRIATGDTMGLDEMRAMTDAQIQRVYQNK